PADGDNDWEKRREIWAQLIKDFDPIVLGTQEGREPQLRDAATLLPHLQMVEGHRQWITERMYPCFFYNPTKIQVLRSGDTWLSETPHIAGSKSFDSAFPRLCVWMEARLIESGKTFFMINTHLDHVREETRLCQAQVLSQTIKAENTNNYPIILCGDFNEAPAGKVRSHLIEQLDLSDPWFELGHHEETSHHKFCGFNEAGARIDWILTDK